MPVTKSATEPGGRLASYVDRIVRGEKPADSPVQAPTKYGPEERHRRHCRRVGGEQVRSRPIPSCDSAQCQQENSNDPRSRSARVGVDHDSHQLGVHEAEECAHGAGGHEGPRLHELFSMMNTPTAPSTEPPVGLRRCRHFRTVIENAHLSSLSRPTSAGTRPRRRQRPRLSAFRRSPMGTTAGTIAGAWSSASPGRLRTDQRPDVRQDRRDRDHRGQRQQRRDDAEPGQTITVTPVAGIADAPPIAFQPGWPI